MNIHKNQTIILYEGVYYDHILLNVALYGTELGKLHVQNNEEWKHLSQQCEVATFKCMTRM